MVDIHMLRQDLPMAFLSQNRSSGTTSNVGAAGGSQRCLLSVSSIFILLEHLDFFIGSYTIWLLPFSSSKYPTLPPFLPLALFGIGLPWLPCGKRLRLPSHAALCFLLTSFFLVLITTCCLVSALEEEKTFLLTIPPV